MKKLIAILLVLLVASVAFGATGDQAASTSLNLISTVQASSDLIISDDDVPSGFGVGDWSNITPTSSVTFTDNNLSTTLNIFMKSNIRAGWDVVVDTPSVLSTGTPEDGTIGYTINTEVVDGSTNITIASIGAGNGMRVATGTLDIVMDSDDWAAASADVNYTATLSINMVSK